MDKYYQQKDIQACTYNNFDKYKLYHCNVDPYGYWSPIETFPCNDKGEIFNKISESCCEMKINNYSQFKQTYNDNMYACIRSNYDKSMQPNKN